MKKILFFASALAGLFLAGSCQREKLESYASGSVTYTITLPETVQTKGEDGYAEYDLYYEVYKTVDAAELEEATPLFEKKISFKSPAINIPLELLNDQDYTILFWANKKDQKWFDTENLRNVKMLKSASNNEDRDAFCGMDEIVNQNGTLSRTVELKRPFAQLNISTIVPNTPEFDVTPVSSMVKVRYIPEAYNVATAKPVGEDVEVTYADKEIPEAYIATDYTKVAMNYLLVPEGTIDVYYEITTRNGVVKNSVPNVPVKANHRTNIIGNLLTSDATYTVNVSDGFEDSETGGEKLQVIADGIAKLQSTGEYQISNANGLVYASQNLFGKEDGSYVLTSDIDMSGYAAVETKAGDKFWEPVEISHKTFVFDGNGHSISNLPDMFVRYTIWGDLTIKNLTLNNPKIASDLEDKTNKGVGAFFGFSDASNKILLENCHVKGGEIAGGHWTGGLIGFTAGHKEESILTIKNCSVKEATVTGKGSCGGIIGHANGGTGLVEMNTISVFSSIIKSTGTDNNKAGSVMGTVGSSTVRVTNCSVIDNEVTSNDVENAKLWGRQGSTTGVLYVDGVQVEDFGAFTPSTTITVTNDEELAKALAVIDFKVIKLASGTYSNDIKLTVADLGSAVREIKFEAAEGAEPVIAGTVTLGYRDQGTGAAMWDGNVTFEGITFDHAENAKHSLDVQDVKSLILKNCTIIGDGEYGLGSASGNGTGPSLIDNCTFENAAMQILGNFGTGLVIEECIFNQSRINVQGGTGVTVQNCTFNNTLKSAHVGDSFYCVRSNAIPITVKGCEINIDSELTEVAADQAKWGILWNRKEKDWTVENVAVTLSEAALIQAGLLVTKCSSTGKINTTNLTVNGKVYASTAEQLTAAVNNGATDIVLAGEFEMPSSGTTNAIQFTSLNGTSVIDNTKGSYWDTATLTFNNVNFKTGTGKVNGSGADYAALYSKNVTYNSCTFTGPMRLGRDGAKFNACTFNGLGNDYVWTYGNAASFDGCTFNTEGKAILIYSDGPTVEHGAAPAVSVTNCTFNATQGAKAGAIVNQNCAAVEIHNYGNGVTLTTSGNTVDEDFSGVWRIKTYETRFLESKIFVNGIEYTTIALDGKTMTIDGDKNVTVE